MWLLQQMASDFIEGESNSSRIKEVLIQKKIDFDEVVFYKPAESWEVLNQYSQQYLDDSDNYLKNRLNKKPFIMRGSVRLAEDYADHPNRLLRGNYIDFMNIDLNIPNKDHLLNKPVNCGFINEIYPISDRFFIRPMMDNKAITGGVMTEGEFYQLQKYYSTYHNADKIEQTPLMMSHLQDILSEYRFFVVDRKISTCSQYMEKEKLKISNQVPVEVINYVNYLIPYNTKGTYVIDIAVLKTGDLKIIEYNNFESSGLYASDEEKIVEDLQKLLNK